MKRLLALFILVPIGIVVIALAVANRQMVTLSVPPQIGDEPFLSFAIPLYALIFATLIVGMLIGSFATWIKQGRHRKQARAQKVEAVKMAGEAEKQKSRADDLVDEMTSEQKALTALGLPAPSKAA